MQKLLFSMLLIVSGLLLGYLWQLRIKKTDADADTQIPRIRKFLQKIGLLGFMPVSFVGAVWIVSFENLKIILLPFIGLIALLSGGVLALGLASYLGKGSKARGTLYCCGSFTNIGSIGALVAFVFLGEKGFGLIALYKMFEEVSYYTIGFPLARYFSGSSDKVTFRQRLLDISKDPFVRAALAAFGSGLILNLTSIPRPEFFETLNTFFVPAGTFILLISIGLGMRFSSVTGYYLEGLQLCLIKFILVPVIAVTLGYLAGFRTIDNGLALKVVLIASSMPVAFTALVAASIYDLELDLANSCWLLTTSALILVLPMLSFLLQLI